MKHLLYIALYRGVYKKCKEIVNIGVLHDFVCFQHSGCISWSLKDLFDAKYYADTYEDLKTAFRYDEDSH